MLREIFQLMHMITIKPTSFLPPFQANHTIWLFIENNRRRGNLHQHRPHVFLKDIILHEHGQKNNRIVKSAGFLPFPSQSEKLRLRNGLRVSSSGRESPACARRSWRWYSIVIMRRYDSNFSYCASFYARLCGEAAFGFGLGSGPRSVSSVPGR